MSKPNECSKCGCQELEYKSGVSKKNGKPWAGWKCTNQKCGEMSFENTRKASPTPAVGGNEVVELLENILEELKVANGMKRPVVKIAKEDKSETPF